MKTCDAFDQKVAEFAALPPAEVPEWVLEHTAGCHRCHRRFAAARLTQALLQSAAGDIEPPAGFAERIAVLASRRSGPSRTRSEFWRPAWGLVPAFGAVVFALLVLLQNGLTQESAGFFPTEGLSTGELLVLGQSPAEPEVVLAAVMEGGGR